MESTPRYCREQRVSAILHRDMPELNGLYLLMGALNEHRMMKEAFSRIPFKSNSCIFSLEYQRTHCRLGLEFIKVWHTVESIMWSAVALSLNPIGFESPLNFVCSLRFVYSGMKIWPRTDDGSSLFRITYLHPMVSIPYLTHLGHTRSLPWWNQLLPPSNWLDTSNYL